MRPEIILDFDGKLRLMLSHVRVYHEAVVKQGQTVREYVTHFIYTDNTPLVVNVEKHEVDLAIKEAYTCAIRCGAPAVIARLIGHDGQRMRYQMCEAIT